MAHVTPLRLWQTRKAAETPLRTARDVIRAMLWVCTFGLLDGGFFSGLVHPLRVAANQAAKTPR